MKNKGEILATVLLNYKGCCFFLHNTKDFDIVEDIMKEGFVFESQLLHSSDKVNPGETIEVTYFLIHRKDYGSFTIIIAIPAETFESYTKAAISNNLEIEEILSVTRPFYGDNDELIYTISPKHILGYFNNKTAEFYLNRNWDPYFSNLNGKSFLTAK